MPGHSRRRQTKQLDDLAKAEFPPMQGKNNPKPILVGQGLRHGQQIAHGFPP
jgi:hypothetical protein